MLVGSLVFEKEMEKPQGPTESVPEKFPYFIITNHGTKYSSDLSISSLIIYVFYQKKKGVKAIQGFR